MLAISASANPLGAWKIFWAVSSLNCWMQIGKLRVWMASNHLVANLWATSPIFWHFELQWVPFTSLIDSPPFGTALPCTMANEGKLLQAGRILAGKKSEASKCFKAINQQSSKHAGSTIAANFRRRGPAPSAAEKPPLCHANSACVCVISYFFQLWYLSMINFCGWWALSIRNVEGCQLKCRTNEKNPSTVWKPV